MVRSVVIRPVQQSVPEVGPELGGLTTNTRPSGELILERSEPNFNADKENGEKKYEINQQALAVLNVGDVVYVAGEFEGITDLSGERDKTKKYIAAFSRKTRKPIPNFDIEVNGKVNALAYSPRDKTLYPSVA